jgi:hypothetical protein
MTRQTTQAGPGSEFFTRREVVLAPVAAEDLVAWYPFREGTGADITAGSVQFGDSTDYSATVNGASFKPSGGVTDIKTGANSGAFDFDGVDDKLNLGTVADSNQSLTFMGWFNFDSSEIGDFSRGILKVNGDAPETDGTVALSKVPANAMRLFTFNGSNPNTTSSSSTVTADTYIHAAARYDFSTGDGTVFVNGQPEGTVSVGKLAPYSSQAWTVGAQVNPQNNLFFNGTVDGARIYTAALSDSQINQIYLNTKP